MRCRRAEPAWLVRVRLALGPHVEQHVDLQAAINRYLDHANHDPKPFVWTANPEQHVIAAVKRGKNLKDFITLSATASP